MDSSAGAHDRRSRAAHTWDLTRGAVIVASGLPIPIAGTDGFHPFHSHPEFTHLAGEALPGAVLAFDPGDGWTLFAPVASLEDRVWSGDSRPLKDLAEASGLDRVVPTANLATWLEARRGEPIAIAGNHDFLRHPGAYGATNWQELEIEIDVELSERLSTAISEARRTKLPDEVQRMRSAVAASAPGHFAAMHLARAGMSERQLQVEIEAAFFRNGGERTAYGSIVGSGPNAAVLHIAPGTRRLRGGDLVLVDAASEYRSYGADITRTFPVNRAFDGIQRDVYQLVLEVQETAIASVRPGIEYKELHMAASRQIADGLATLGILRGNPDDLVERDAHALFFPHGLGHMLGLATHDSGGCLAGRTPSDRFGLKWLRADLPLAEGYVVTIEPGIYFIPAIIEDQVRREAYADAVDWACVDALAGFGGVRIEDDVLVTATAADVLSSAIPKSIGEIEAIRQEALSE